MFVDEANDLLEAKGQNKIRSPFDLLDIWDGVVSDMETGYNFNIYEYDNDVSVRRTIQLILESNILRKYPEYEGFKEKVASIDERFRRILSDTYIRSERSLWWEAGILRNAGEEYVKDIEDLYGFKL